MALPGFSVSDLIQALSQAKIIYDAFFNEYTSSAAQVRDLAEEIESFRRNLNKHRQVLEVHGLEYEGFTAVYRTLNSCHNFLDKYKIILDQQRRKSVAATYKTAKFVFDLDEVNRLRDQIHRHDSNILHHSLNIILDKTVNKGETVAPLSVSPVPIRNPHPDAISPSPPATPLLGSPLLPQSQFTSIPARSSSSSTSGERPHPVLFESPQLLPASLSTLPPSSSSASPLQRNSTRSSQNTLNIPGLALPQSALPYCVAEVFFGNKKVELKRKAAGRDTDGGREMVIYDELGNLRFRHRIKVPRTQLCYPYTWHRRWQEKHDHDALEVSFIGTTAEAHSISFKGAPAISAIPKYIFNEPKDFRDFQSELRGKVLEDTFEVRQITSASSSRNGEATDQHLKIWKDYVTKECSVSFYASAIPHPCHKEFPLAMFEQELNKRGEVQLCLNFALGAEPKRGRTFSKAFSRSPTETTFSTSTSVPGVFTRNNTIASSASSVTTSSRAPSRMSIGNQTDAGLSPTERTKGEPSLESIAKSMKYVRIEFSDEKESTRFRKTYDRLYQEEISRPQDFFPDWGLGAGRDRAESVVSNSPNGTPFNMSPVLHPMRRGPSRDNLAT